MDSVVIAVCWFAMKDLRTAVCGESGDFNSGRLIEGRHHGGPQLPTAGRNRYIYIYIHIYIYEIKTCTTIDIKL